MDYVEQAPLPAVCQNCADRAACIARGEGEWCCEECENLLERFICMADDTDKSQIDIGFRFREKRDAAL